MHRPEGFSGLQAFHEAAWSDATVEQLNALIEGRLPWAPTCRRRPKVAPRSSPERPSFQDRTSECRMGKWKGAAQCKQALLSGHFVAIVCLDASTAL